MKDLKLNDYPLNIFIVEDQRNDLQDLLEVIDDYFKGKLYLGPKSIASKVDEAVRKIEALQKEGKIDLLFLDLLMYQTVESIAILKKLKKIDFEIICITNYPSMARRIEEEFGDHYCGFIDKKSLPEAQAANIRCALEVFHNKRKLYAVKVGNSDLLKIASTEKGKQVEYFINPQEIMMIKSDGNFKIFYLTNKEGQRINRHKIMIKRNWKVIEHLFELRGMNEFQRIHDKFAININYLFSHNRADNLVYLQCDQTNTSPLQASIGPKYREAFLRLLNQLDDLENRA